MEELAWYDATAQAALVRRGEVRPRELVEASVRRIERSNPALNAVVLERFERALAEADEHLPGYLPGQLAGPFAGVPLLLKDLGCALAGEPLYRGMRLLAERRWVEDEDAELTRRFRAAGLVVCGRTNVPELGQTLTTEPRLYGPARNPWDSSRSTGGSSGGSASAVAAAMVPLAHGNDAAGSIRNPAGHCGLVGLKPSRSRIPDGPRPESLTDTHVEGVLTRSVRDAAGLLDALVDPVPQGAAATAPAGRYADVMRTPPGRLRVGMLRRIPTDLAPLHDECAAGVERAARALADLGHDVAEEHPAVLDDVAFSRAGGLVHSVHLAWRLAHWSRVTGHEIGPDDVEPYTWAFAAWGREVPAWRMLAAQATIADGSRRMAEWYARGFDVLLLASTATPAPPLGELMRNTDDPLAPGRRILPAMLLTGFANLTGQPAISLPLHWTADGLPVGVQLAAAPGREDLLLQVAAQLEQAAPWAQRRPPAQVEALRSATSA